jgi:hypothetical protein
VTAVPPPPRPKDSSPPKAPRSTPASPARPVPDTAAGGPPPPRAPQRSWGSGPSSGNTSAPVSNAAAGAARPVPSVASRSNWPPRADSRLPRSLEPTMNHWCAGSEPHSSSHAPHVVTRLGEAVRALSPGGVHAALDTAVRSSRPRRGPVEWGLRCNGRRRSASTPARHPGFQPLDPRRQRPPRRPRLSGQCSSLTFRVSQTMPVGQVAAAHRRLAKGGLRGRLVLTC